MNAILTTVLAFFGPNGILYALLGAIVVAFGWSIRRGGTLDERAKQAAAEAKARDIADQVDNDVGALTPDQRRRGMKSWSND